ncbi:MAG: prephenate dehydrogenase [Anaerolineae bacterium]
MAKAKISIIGLGLIGGSIGLALQEKKGDFEVVGHDREPEVSARARKMKVVDRTDWNLISACEGAEIVIIATPLAGVEQTLRTTAPYLKPGCLVTDTASFKAPVLRWAQELLPPGVNFVGGDPIIFHSTSPIPHKESGLEAARADLFSGRLYCLFPASNAAPEAVELASDLVQLLGARPYFLDVYEHDGLMAGAHQLPLLLATALLGTTTGSSSWREMRKLAGETFHQATGPACGDAEALCDSCLSNKENVIRWLDEFMRTLLKWKELIAGEEGEELLSALENALTERERWLRERAEGFRDIEPIPMPERTGFLRRLIGF